METSTHGKGAAAWDPGGVCRRRQSGAPRSWWALGSGGGLRELTMGRSQPNSCLLNPTMKGTGLNSFCASISSGIFGSSTPSTTVVRTGRLWGRGQTRVCAALSGSPRVRVLLSACLSTARLCAAGGSRHRAPGPKRGANSGTPEGRTGEGPPWAGDGAISLKLKYIRY